MTIEAKENPTAPSVSIACVQDAKDEPSTQTIPLDCDDEAKGTPSTPNVRLACVEISHFRRLSAVRVAIDAETTILVGANNSGKTSILQAIRQFLADSPAFGAHDLCVDLWPKLNQLGKAWEALDEDPASDDSNPLPWDQHLLDILACMPTLDLWFNARPGAFHVVSPFIPSLQWSGGPVGVRLRLEPASTVKDLQKLAWQFREARQIIRDLDPSAKTWPMNLIDYWLRHPSHLGNVVVYKLDPAKGPLGENPPGAPQSLPDNAIPLERVKLALLVRVDFIAAQRGLGAEEADGRPGTDPHQVGLFSNQLLRFVRRHLDPTGQGPGNHPDLVLAIAKAQDDLDEKIRSALAPSIKDVRTLGYPGLHDPQEIHLRTRIQTGDLLDHNTAVQYRMDGQANDVFLPEHAIGLGYQNLQSLSYQLVSFRETRLNPAKGAPAAVHLVLVEEPEAHLHVQVQRVFPRRALKLITSENADHSHLASQLILSTHASHLAHAESFTRLRYVRRLKPIGLGAMPSSEVVNLADAFGDDDETRTFAERYFQVQHTDLLFADAAIFVEGTAERMLIPFFIDRDFPALSSRYLSFLDIGGSHAHRLRPLVERLGIPTVVITDIDPVRVTKGPDGKTTRKAEAITDQTALECGNDTLTMWHPKATSLTAFSRLSGPDQVWSNDRGGKVRFAWQMPVPSGGPWPSSFEDAFILTNLEWFKDQTGEKGSLGSAVRTVQQNPDPAGLNVALHELLRGSFKKGDFAASIFEALCAGKPLQCPGYISDALAWLQEELEPTTAGGQA
jgi:predicted ATP-dependent endonuclease of OLD family